MNLILPLDFIDVSVMAATLIVKHSVHFADDTRRQTFKGSPHHDTETILLRGPEGLDETPDDKVRDLWQADVPHENTPLLESWRSAQNVMAAVADSHRRRSGLEAVFGKIMVVSLKAGGYVDWHVDQGPYAEAHDRFHICMVPSPGAVTYSGGAGAALGYGLLTYMNNRVLHSAVNLGAIARVHLVFDIRKPAQETIQ